MSYGNTHTVITDVTVTFCSPGDPACVLDPAKWHRVEKDLLLHSVNQSAWLHIIQEKETELSSNNLVITDVRVGDLPLSDASNNDWERRPGGIWLRRSKYTGNIHQALSGVDVLFGVDAADPRPQWILSRASLQLLALPEVPVARLSVRYGRAEPRLPAPALRAGADGNFKVLQISDTHMVTGVGVCKDAIDASGQPLPESEADPLTVGFVDSVLEAEKPDLVLLTGDQAHHDHSDTKSIIFKLVASLISRSIPYAIVFGNHDDEGAYALSRTFSNFIGDASDWRSTKGYGDTASQATPTPLLCTAQMSILQDLPFSLCQPGPDHVDGVGNYYLQVLGHTPSELPLLTLYLLDSHGEISSQVQNPDYGWIKQSQMDWFTDTAQSLRKAREEQDGHDRFAHLSLAFMHIPLPEFAQSNLVITGGDRREPTEGPSFNSRFYDILVKQGVAAVGCGHDHVNDFCGLLPHRLHGQHRRFQPNGETKKLGGPWLCYAGTSGFGGYGSYGGKYYHRRARIWDFDTKTGGIKTWKRVEYADHRIDETVLVKNGTVFTPLNAVDGDNSGSSAQVIL